MALMLLRLYRFYISIKCGHALSAGIKKKSSCSVLNQQGACYLTSATSSSSLALHFVLLGAPTSTALRHHLLLDHVDDLVWDSQVLDGASSDITLRHPPKLISILSESKGRHQCILLK